MLDIVEQRIHSACRHIGIACQIIARAEIRARITTFPSPMPEVVQRGVGASLDDIMISLQVPGSVEQLAFPDDTSPQSIGRRARLSALFEGCHDLSVVRFSRPPASPTMSGLLNI